MPVRGKAANSGDDIAGVVHAVGASVYGFRPGDRVAAFHEMGRPGGSFAEYAVAPQHTTFHLPVGTTFEQAATVPLAAMTAAVGLYQRLGLPAPWSADKPTGKQPLLVYGAATAVGAFAIQLARLSGIHPIIGVAGRGIPFAESLLDKSKGDAVVDYRGGDTATVAGIKAALRAAGCGDGDGEVPLRYVFDGVSESGSPANVRAVLGARGGNVTHVLGGYEAGDGASTLKSSYTMVGSVYRDDKDFGFVWFQYFSRLLEDGRLKAHPVEKRGGLEGVSGALKDLRAGKASAVKYVFEIGNRSSSL
jgi:NADPH2:quinone reductase